ncbi:hypothetical protein B0H17DRAFT_1178840, partial [Mycena rosella]
MRPTYKTAATKPFGSQITRAPELCGVEPVPVGCRTNLRQNGNGFVAECCTEAFYVNRVDKLQILDATSLVAAPSGLFPNCQITSFGWVMQCIQRHPASQSDTVPILGLSLAVSMVLAGPTYIAAFICGFPSLWLELHLLTFEMIGLKEDRLSKPNRPIVSGRISLQSAQLYLCVGALSFLYSAYYRVGGMSRNWFLKFFLEALGYVLLLGHDNYIRPRTKPFLNVHHRRCLSADHYGMHSPKRILVAYRAGPCARLSRPIRGCRNWAKNTGDSPSRPLC